MHEYVALRLLRFAIASQGGTIALWRDFCILEVKMNKSVEVKAGKPAANKKGLRIMVTGVELDEENNLISMHIDYSGFRIRGGAVIEVSDRNKIELPEV